MSEDGTLDGAERRLATDGGVVRRIVLADDHAFVLEGLRTALEARSGWQVVASAANGVEAIALVKQHRPDLAVLDDAMPGATGLEAFVEARRWNPETRFVILTGMISPARLAEMDALGVDGILLKSMSSHDICYGVERVLAGERVVGEEVGRFVEQRATRDHLTPREVEVLAHIARGLANPGIAEALGLSAKTVESHRSSLMRKMGARNTANLLVRAMRDGLIDT